MIPTTSTVDLTIEDLPSLNYRMDFAENINGKVDNLEAMKQVIYKILMTERYKHLIYSWNYGIEIGNLIGKPVDYVKSEAERLIKEALLQDERIKAVDTFSFDTSKRHELLITFTVHTIYGDASAERTVNY